MDEFRLQVRIKNNLLISLREGLKLTPREMADKIGLSYPLYLKYEGLKQSPLARTGAWSRSAQKIAAFFNVSPDDLWPDVILAVQTPTAERIVGAEQVNALFASEAARSLMGEELAPDQPLDIAQRDANVRAALATLTPRERMVIESRFGIDRDHTKGYTLQAVADALDVDRERVRQIEAKALRKLRHPSRSRNLTIFTK